MSDTKLRRRSVLQYAKAAAIGLAAPSLIRTPGALAEAIDDLPYSLRALGCTIHGGGVANTRYTSEHSYRFRCERTGFIRSVRWWHRINRGDTGYSTGDGGQIEIQLRPDNGAAFGLPDSPVLARTEVVTRPLALNNSFHTLEFQRPPEVVKGLLYHIVFRQLRYRSGAVSVNGLHIHSQPHAPLYPYWGDDLADIMFRGGRWQLRADRAPIFDLNYTDGIVKGQGISMGRRTETRTIGGDQGVLQTFYTGRGSRTASKLRFWAYRTSDAPLDLTVRIWGPRGEVDRIVVPWSQVSRSTGDFQGAARIGWVEVPLSSALPLEAQRYYMVGLSAPAGASYRIIGVQDGSAITRGSEPYFQEDKLMRGGRAFQTGNGGRNWSGTTFYDQADRTDADWPCHFAMV
jgi:hypothetical protein